VMAIKPALIGKAGELLVAAELMRRGVEVAHPASDVGVDLLAYRLNAGNAVPARIVPIQVKAYSATGYVFEKLWFNRAPGVALVSVWLIPTTPEFYVLESLSRVEVALGAHSATQSWKAGGAWSSTSTLPGSADWKLMQPHRDKWCRIIDQL
jgi:hypothetical protein